MVGVDGERQLHPHLSPELVVLSFCISWLGAYTSIQLHIHADSATSRVMYWMWTAAGSVAFGFCAIWSMHYLGMLACKFDAKIDFNKTLTFISAVVAVGLTFAASLSNDAWKLRFLRRWTRCLMAFAACKWWRRENVDYSALYDDDIEAPGFALEPTGTDDDYLHRVDAAQSAARGRRSRIRLGARAEDEDDDADADTEGEKEGVDGGHFMVEWKPWLLEQYAQISIFHLLRAVILAGAIVSMFYFAMWAMEIDQGRIEWHFGRIVVSYLFTLGLCFGACVAMLHMEVSIGRQITVATLSAMSVCSMHYFGMEATTMFTRAPADPATGFPAYLTWTIISGAIAVCVVANALLANRAILARRRMAETIRTKRRLWRIIAEKDAAERAHELKQQFISVASHEIRTPLHTVSGYAELLARTNLSPEQMLYLTNIQQACHAVNVIAENVLDFSKLERDNKESQAHPVVVEPRKMVESIARIASTSEPRMGHRTVDTVISVSPRVPKAVMLDETYALRVLMNLYSNAAKFTESGFISIAMDVDPDVRRLSIIVRDTGVGIPPGFREAIFEPFRQADSSLTRAHHGAGLGLSIVKHLVERLHGTITVDSVLGGGSTFNVTLPIERADMSRPRPGHPPSPPPPPPRARKRRVKVVAADPRSERLYVDLWTLFGADASVASPRTPRDELCRRTDLVWADAENVAGSASLASLMADPRPGERERGDAPPPMLCIVHARAEDLVTLGAGVKSDSVFLVRQPVVMHAVLAFLDVAERGMHEKTASAEIPPVLQASVYAADRPPASVNPAAASGTVLDSLSTDPARGKVLLVEDNLINQRLGKRLVEKLGYEVVTANNGQEAVELAKRNEFRLCLMDCQMPILDGFAATQKIRELERDGTLVQRMRIIALTANVTFESEEKCRCSGMDHFLPKPLRLDALSSALEQA